MNKFSKMALLMATAGATAAAATPSAGGAAPGAVPESNAPEAAKATRAPKNPDNILDIVNGRLPLPLVFQIRFKETGTVADTAKKYGTSVGKVFDIKKGRNFGYITEAYKPSADEIKAAKDWLTVAKTNRTQKTLGELMGAEPVAALVKNLDAMGVATTEEVAARNWQVRVVGQAAAAGTAPVAEGGAAPTAAAAPAATGTKGGAAAPAGAKLF